MEKRRREEMDEIFIHPTASVETTQIGGNTKIWQHVVIQQGSRIGSDCRIGANVFIETDAGKQIRPC